MAHEPCRRPHHPHHACCADASRGSAAHTRGEKCAMPVRLHAERRLLHAPVSSCPCSRPEGREMPTRIRTERQLLLRSPRALTLVPDAVPANLARAPYGSHNARVSVKRNRNAESAQNCRARVREMRKRTAMENKDIRAALDRHWAASDANNFDEEHQIYREDAVLEYPQSGERIRGRRNIQASRFAQPNKKRFTVRRILGAADLWVTEFVLTYDGQPSYSVSIMEFNDGKVARETQYFGDPFEPGPSRAQWVEPMR